MKVNVAVVKVLKRELNCDYFTLQCDTPLHFVQCQWQNEDEIPILYLLYRWCFAIYFLVTMVISIVVVGRENITALMRAKWLIYLTNWSYTACTIQALVAMLLVTQKFIQQRRNANSSQLAEMCYKYKIYWVLNTMALSAAFTVTTYYWVAIYSPGIDIDALNLLVHAFNSVFMLLDLCILAHPIRLLHFYIPLTFSCIYCLFSVVYYFAGGTNTEGYPYVYSILDWRDPGIAIAACAAGLVAVLIFHTLAWLIFIWRTAVASRIKKEKKVTKPEASVSVHA